MISFDSQIIPFIERDQQDLEKSCDAWIAKNFGMFCMLSRLT